MVLWEELRALPQTPEPGSGLSRRQYRAVGSELTRGRPGWWPELFEGFSWEMHLPGGEHGIRVEESTEEGAYVVRAELPGIDPGKDVEITVQDEILTAHAERSWEECTKHRSDPPRLHAAKSRADHPTVN